MPEQPIPRPEFYDPEAKRQQLAQHLTQQTQRQISDELRAAMESEIESLVSAPFFTHDLLALIEEHVENKAWVADLTFGVAVRHDINERQLETAFIELLKKHLLGDGTS